MAGNEEVVAAYRLPAAHCTEIAQHTSDPKNRLILLRMAAAWLTLAEQAEKNSLVYKTPVPIQQQQQPGADVSKNAGLVANWLAVRIERPLNGIRRAWGKRPATLKAQW